MTVHPEIAKVLATLPTPDHSTPPDPVTMRASEAERVPPLEERVPLHAVEDVTAATSAGEVPVRIYTPVEADSYGLLVYFHGGAFFSGSLDTHDGVARSLAKETGHEVVSVGYRLAPESAYPAGLQDCYGVLRWAAEHGADLKWDGGNLAVAGDSSGGNFVAGVTAMAHDDGFDRVTHQVLFYPSVDLDFDLDRYASLRENARGYGLETDALKPFNSFYLDSGADPSDPLVSPVKRADLSGLPSALVITAEYDPLRDEGERYGRRLAEAGVDTRVSRYAGANHGFVVNFAWLEECYRAFRETAEFLKRP
ncbi:alpha/beta hydrolase [Actinopolyspora halophila]|uniref:alpha/beta hydrolase n=1 Tax=Actinopolyspora halophila TaxID=1850 RepID=UPI0003772323|nr:alpha/beta hydrolase [Actinopolyspora halophila]